MRDRLDRAAVVDEAFELDHLRNEVEIDRHAVRPDDRLDLQGHAGISGFEAGRSRRRDREGRAAPSCDPPIGLPSLPVLPTCLRNLAADRNCVG